jgi:hypothetical protein
MAEVSVAGYGLRVARSIFQPATRNTQLATLSNTYLGILLPATHTSAITPVQPYYPVDFILTILLIF